MVEITPPVDAQGNYMLNPGQAFGPTSPTWIWCSAAGEFYCDHRQPTRLSNGDTLIDYGVNATFIEINSLGKEVWKYVSPYTAAGTLGPTTPIPNLGGGHRRQTRYANFTFQAIFYPIGYITPAPCDKRRSRRNQLVSSFLVGPPIVREVTAQAIRSPSDRPQS